LCHIIFSINYILFNILKNLKLKWYEKDISYIVMCNKSIEL